MKSTLTEQIHGLACTTCSGRIKHVPPLDRLGDQCELCRQPAGLVAEDVLTAILRNEARLSTPIADGIQLRRDSDGAHKLLVTNVPHFAMQHSPTGYEWGYGGSGPSDLALNIAEWFLRSQSFHGERMRVQHDDPDRGSYFRLASVMKPCIKSMLVEPMPHEGGTIPFEDLVDVVRAWDRTWNKQYPHVLREIWHSIDYDEAVEAEEEIER